MNNAIKGNGLHPSGFDMRNGAIVVRIDKALKNLIPSYLDTRREDVQKLRRAIADKDLERSVFWAIA